jgi:anti-sigma B factor antagonist
MPAKRNNIQFRQHGLISIINLQGEINATLEEALKSAYAEAIAPNPSAILLNLSDVEYITSTGMAILVGLLAQAHQANRRLAACGLSEHYREVFQITRMADFMEIYTDEASALNQLQRS